MYFSTVIINTEQFITTEEIWFYWFQDHIVSDEKSSNNEVVNKDCIQSMNEDNQLTLTSIGHESSTSFTFVDDSGGLSMDKLSHKLKVGSCNAYAVVINFSIV